MQKIASGKKRKKKGRASDEDVELALGLHAHGMGYKRIGRKLGHPWRTVANWITGRCRKDLGAHD